MEMVFDELVGSATSWHFMDEAGEHNYTEIQGRGTTEWWSNDGWRTLSHAGLDACQAALLHQLHDICRALSIWLDVRALAPRPSETIRKTLKIRTVKSAPIGAACVDHHVRRMMLPKLEGLDDGGDIRQKATRVKTGCLTCRQRKKKCSRERPRCGLCERLNLICRWEEPRDPFRRRLSQQSSCNDGSVVLLKAPDPNNFWLDPSDVDTTILTPLSRRGVLRYYTQTFSLILTTNLSNNGFLSVFLPMAMESNAIRSALLALSSSHLALCHPSYRLLDLQIKSEAFTSLSESLNNSKTENLEALAACLALCSMEAIIGDTSDWYQHLVGASHLITNATNPKTGESGLAVIASTFEGRWLLRNFAYHDILMSISMNQAPLIPGDYWDVDKDSDLVDSYFGLATFPMKTISRISTLASHAKSFKRSELDEEVSTHMDVYILEEALRLESELIKWTCPSSDDQSLVLLADTYRSAALIHLFRACRTHGVHDPQILQRKIDDGVTSIITAVEQMPAECLPECTLLFPLFLAGGECRNVTQTLLIKQRLDDMERFRRFQNVRLALGVLEELWRVNHVHDCVDCADSPSPGRADWLDITARRKWRLALS